MFEFADSRSSLRAAIGYDNADAISTVVQQHNENKVLFEKYFAIVENTIVSEEGRKTYDAICSELDAYWALDQQIMDLGATTDRELCKQAQDIALEDLAPAYNSIYSKLESLLNVKVTEGNQLSTRLSVAGLILSIAIVVVIAASLTLSTKIGRTIAKGIAAPLGKLGNRLKTFSAGDLTSPFPLVETGDEVEHPHIHRRSVQPGIIRLRRSCRRVTDTCRGRDRTDKRSDGTAHHHLRDHKHHGDERTERGRVLRESAALRRQGGQQPRGDEFKQIADFSKNLKTMVQDQTEAMRQAERGINQISEVVQSNAATAQEASATSQELSAQATILNGLIGQFSLPK